MACEAVVPAMQSPEWDTIRSAVERAGLTGLDRSAAVKWFARRRMEAPKGFYAGRRARLILNAAMRQMIGDTA